MVVSIYTAYLLLLLAVTQVADTSQSVHAETAFLQVIIIGATGNLAAKYLWVACFRFALKMAQSSIRVHFIATARDSHEEGSQWIKTYFDDMWLQRVCESTIRSESHLIEQCQTFYHVDFLPHIEYVSLQHDINYVEVAARLNHQVQMGRELGRLVYLAIPPAYFLSTCQAIHTYLRPSQPNSSLRVVIEKPFGHDLMSATDLATSLRSILTDDEILLIDHYAGKRSVQAMESFLTRNHVQLVPLWNRHHIEEISIQMNEVETCQGRIQYFHPIGIIRDIMVNHLQLLLSIIVRPSQVACPVVAIHCRVSSYVEFMDSLHLKPNISVQVGQYDLYAAHYHEAGKVPADDKLIGRTLTAASVVLESSQSQWQQTVFKLAAAKATKERVLRIHVKFNDRGPTRTVCSIIITIQQGPTGPNSGDQERIELIGCQKNLFYGLVPPDGWNVEIKPNLSIMRPRSHATRRVWELGDDLTAYDRLLVRSITRQHKSSHSPFVDLNYILASWRLWTPVIQETEQTMIQPFLYPVGTDPWQQPSATQHHEDL